MPWTTECEQASWNCDFPLVGLYRKGLHESKYIDRFVSTCLRSNVEWLTFLLVWQEITLEFWVVLKYLLPCLLLIPGRGRRWGWAGDKQIVQLTEKNDKLVSISRLRGPMISEEWGGRKVIITQVYNVFPQLQCSCYYLSANKLTLDTRNCSNAEGGATLCSGTPKGGTGASWW